MEFKKKPGIGMCPCKGCRNKIGKKKTLCDKHHSRKWRAAKPLASTFQTLRMNAKRRGKTFTITLDDYIAIVSQNSYMDNKGKRKYNLHLDRIDNTKGYEPGNIQVLTCSDNCAKADRKNFVPYFANKTKGFIDEPF